MMTDEMFKRDGKEVNNDLNMVLGLFLYVDSTSSTIAQMLCLENMMMTIFCLLPQQRPPLLSPNGCVATVVLE